MKVVFTGDFSASGIFHEKILSGDPLFDPRILAFFKNTDFVHINLENPITDADFRKKNGECLKAPPVTGEFLKNCGITICNLANNHIMDCGIQGLKDTIFSLSKNRILYYGIGNEANYTLLKKEDLTVVLLSSCHKEGPLWKGTTIAPLNMSISVIKTLVGQIKKAENPDYIIYNYHGGTEFNVIPEPRRRAFFHTLIQECEIDVVIGHHAHVAQGIEWIENQIIVYGLGNLCFDLDYQKAVPFTNISYFIELTLERDHQKSFKKYFYVIDYEKQMIRLITDPSFTNAFFQQREVFTSDVTYRDAWEKECFRIYFNNQNRGSSPSGTLLSPSDYFSNTPLNIGKMVSGFLKHYKFSHLPWGIWTCFNEVKSPCRRPYILGAVKYLLKQGFKT